MKIADIQWGAAIYLASGSYGVIYEVAPTRVVKVSYRLTPQDVKAQNYFAARHKALHVLDYARKLQLPEQRIHKEVCSIHGSTDAWGECICQEPVDVILMPKADTHLSATPQLKAFMDMIAEECLVQLGREWDRKQNNVALYRGHFVALDFGDPDS